MASNQGGLASTKSTRPRGVAGFPRANPNVIKTKLDPLCMSKDTAGKSKVL